MIPSARRELRVRTYSIVESLISWRVLMMMEIHIHVKAFSQRACDAVTSCVCVFVKRPFPAACMMSSGSDSSVLGIVGSLHHTRKIQGLRKAICFKDQPNITAVLKGGADTLNGRQTIQRIDSFAKQRWPNYSLVTVNRSVKLWISPHTEALQTV